MKRQKTHITRLASKHDIQIQGSNLKYYNFFQVDTDFKDIELIIEGDISISGGRWINCKFVIDEKIIPFHFKNSKFSLFGQPELKFKNCYFKDGSISGLWKNIEIELPTARISDFQFLFASRGFTANRILFVNCNFDMLCDELSMHDSVFSECVFRPTVAGNTHLENTKYPKSIVSVEGWIDSCLSRETINFSNTKKVIDRWATLRDSYTGFRLSVITTLTVLAFLPYIIKAYLYFGLAQIGEAVSITETLPLWKCC